jgi:predicted RNase H-like HicB family nuclease
VTEYAVVIEDAGKNYSAYVPDLPGCVAAGSSVDEVKAEIRAAIALHIASLREHGEEIPPATSVTSTVQVA